MDAIARVGTRLHALGQRVRRLEEETVSEGRRALVHLGDWAETEVRHYLAEQPERREQLARLGAGLVKLGARVQGLLQPGAAAEPAQGAAGETQASASAGLRAVPADDDAERTGLN